MSPVIEFRRVSKRFAFHATRPRSFLEAFTGSLQRPLRERTAFWALRDISLAVDQGETVGVVGDNGAGKSTLLKLAARIIEPTSGHVAVEGRVGTLLEVGVGFHHDLTGRENIILSGTLMGLRHREVAARMDEIVAFADIGDFIDAPLRHYSSGMLVRLGFAVATCIEPDILLVDEVLSVGDQSFRQRCLERIDQMRARGTAILTVSHNLEEIRRICDRALWLHQGQVQVEGQPDEVIHAYMNHILRERELQVWELGDEEGRGRRFGSGEVEITGAATLDGEGRPCSAFTSSTRFVVRIDYRCRRPVDNWAFGLSIYAQDGTWVTSPNSIGQNEALHIAESGSIYYVVDRLALRPGLYELTVAVFDPTAPQYKPYDHHHRAYIFSVVEGAVGQDGLVEFPHRWLDERGWAERGDEKGDGQRVWMVGGGGTIVSPGRVVRRYQAVVERCADPRVRMAVGRATESCQPPLGGSVDRRRGDHRGAGSGAGGRTSVARTGGL